MDRAYSILTIKSVDDDQRLLDGVASTPDTDRVGDILDPKGAKFALPIPLLWHHNAQEPIGHVIAAKVTDSGIAIRAQIAKGVLPRIDEAWTLIKAGLVRGLSVGFRALDTEPIPHSYGVRFKSWEWLELSAVTIPANASATIHTIKSLDGGHAAAGVGRTLPHATLPGVTGASTGLRMKNASEQITDFQASRTPKAARMSEIMQRAVAEGRTLDTDESTEYDALAAEVKGYDEHIARLQAYEAVQANHAAPVIVPRAPSFTTIGNPEPPKLPPGIEFTRYAMCLAAAKGDPGRAAEIARKRYPDQGRIQTVLKAAVAAGTTTDPTWAGALVDYQLFAGDFIEYLRPMTIIGKFGTNGIPSLQRIPFNVKIAGQTSGGAANWVGQGAAKPLTKFDFEMKQLAWAKVAAISVITEELARFSSPSAEQYVRRGLAEAIVARLDIDFIDPAKALVADVSPASITNGIAALTPSGTDAAAVRADIQTLISTFLAANLTPTSAVWIMPNTVALAISLMTNALGQPEFSGITMTGGSLKGIPVITSQYAVLGGSPDGNLMILLNASDIFLADDGQVVIDVSREASLEMADNPTQSVAGGSPLAPVPSTVVSLWQTNSIGLRAERFINWSRRRTEAVAYLENVQYSA